MNTKTILKHYQGPILIEEIRRNDLYEGDFGAIAPFFCEYCFERDQRYAKKRPGNQPIGTVWDEPEAKLTHKGCGFENFYGPEPDEYENICPVCGSLGTIYDNDTPDLSFKVTNRRKLGLL